MLRGSAAGAVSWLITRQKDNRAQQVGDARNVQAITELDMALAPWSNSNLCRPADFSQTLRVFSLRYIQLI